MIGAFQAGVMGGGEIWTPANITTFQWFDAADTVTLPNSGNIMTAWNDKSGNARHITVISGTPFTNTRKLNNRNVVDFNGSSSVAGSPSYPETTNSTYVFLVMASDVITFSTLGPARFCNASIDGLDNRAYAGIGAAYSPSNKIAARLGGTTGTDDLTALSAITTDPFILHFGRGYQTGGVLYINGTSQGTDNTLANTNPVSVHGFSLAGDTNGYLDGLVAECIVLLTVDTGTRQKIEGYLAHKWGLTARLPSGHPYKITAPTV